MGLWSLRPLRRELAPVANTPLITLELQALHAAGIREIGMVSDAGLATAARDAVGEAGLDVDLVQIDPPAETGLAGRLLAAEPFIGNGPFVVNMAGAMVWISCFADAANIDGSPAVRMAKTVSSSASRWNADT